MDISMLRTFLISLNLSTKMPVLTHLSATVLFVALRGGGHASDTDGNMQLTSSNADCATPQLFVENFPAENIFGYQKYMS